LALELREERRRLDRHAAEIKWLLHDTHASKQSRAKDWMWDPDPEPPLTEKQRAALEMIDRAKAKVACSRIS